MDNKFNRQAKGFGADRKNKKQENSGNHNGGKTGERVTAVITVKHRLQHVN